jgi:hypothetical protein
MRKRILKRQGWVINETMSKRGDWDVELISQCRVPYIRLV